MTGKPYDPRSQAEKARADLARNDAIGSAVPESSLERGPSVTRETFGDTTGKARRREEQKGVEAGGRKSRSTLSHLLSAFWGRK
ncbi:hypothetical protein [Microvirga flavescens]|uniref:hypothetical protein n=1 Tax=Microvirga flavescens TaxID=2249811 RepID=UPI001300BDFB|nr:hypothetical protein [Microvirga flavescens]